jgi:F-type H+-transporting ATPase subunit delta
MYLEQMNRIEVTVFTAQPMNDDQVAQLRTQIHAKLQREPVMISKVEPRMLGGIRLQIGDTLIDASLESRLRKVAQNLADNGLPAIRAASETVFAST